MPTPDLSTLSPGQKDFYESLLADDPQAAEDFLSAILLEQQRDEEQRRPAPTIDDAGIVVQQPTPPAQPVQDYPADFTMAPSRGS